MFKMNSRKCIIFFYNLSYANIRNHSNKNLVVIRQTFYKNIEKILLYTLDAEIK